MKRSYLIRCGDAFSQLLNTVLLNGEPDESISGRSYRRGVLERSRKWLVAMKAIDLLFLPFEKEHCRLAYHADITRAEGLIKSA